MKDNLDDLIDEWHENDIEVPLWEHLGMTKTEYVRWVEDPANAGRAMAPLIDHELVEECRRSVAKYEQEHGPFPSLEEVQSMTAGINPYST